MSDTCFKIEEGKIIFFLTAVIIIVAAVALWGLTAHSKEIAQLGEAICEEYNMSYYSYNDGVLRCEPADSHNDLTIKIRR